MLMHLCIVDDRLGACWSLFLCWFDGFAAHSDETACYARADCELPMAIASATPETDTARGLTRGPSGGRFCTLGRSSTARPTEAQVERVVVKPKPTGQADGSRADTFF